MNNPFLAQIQNQLMGYMQNNPSAFQQFAQSYKGDPKQDVQNMLNSGQLSQPAFNILYQLAQTLSGYNPQK